MSCVTPSNKSITNRVLNQRESAMLHLTHMSNVIHTVNTLFEELKALLRTKLTPTLKDVCLNPPFNTTLVPHSLIPTQGIHLSNIPTEIDFKRTWQI